MNAIRKYRLLWILFLSLFWASCSHSEDIEPPGVEIPDDENNHPDDWYNATDLNFVFDLINNEVTITEAPL